MLLLLRADRKVGDDSMSMLGRAFWAMLGFTREADFIKEEE